jgi:hypothetical protein
MTAIRCRLFGHQWTWRVALRIRVCRRCGLVG